MELFTKLLVVVGLPIVGGLAGMWVFSKLVFGYPTIGAGIGFLIGVALVAAGLSKVR